MAIYRGALLFPYLLKSCSQKFLPIYAIQQRNLRGKAPGIAARTLKQRLEEISRKTQDPNLHFKVNIGLPFLKPSRGEEYQQRMQLLKEKRAVTTTKNKIPIDQIRQEWFKTCGPHHIKNLAEHFNVFEDLFGEAYFLPRVPLQITYPQLDDSVMPVYFGNQIKPAEARLQPHIIYEDSNPSSLWTLLLTNPDGHFTEPNSEYVHWFIGNIPGNEVSKGEEIVSYLQPFPPKGTGSQRLIFVLYKQDKAIDFSLFKKESPCFNLADRTFRTKDFYRNFQDSITPAGLAFFQSDWDHSLTHFFHYTLNMKEPIYEFDFPVPFKKPQVWFPKKQPFNLYLDKHRDPQDIAKELLLKKLKSVDPFRPNEKQPKYPNALPEDVTLPSWRRVEIRKQRLGWGRYSDA